MYIKRNYGFFMTFNWSKRPFIYGALYSAAICALDYYFPFPFTIPWQPISIIGIAVAFYLGFKNNSSYDRTWEARKIWGSIVNNSRSFGAATVSFVKGERANEVQKELIYRHIAWLTSLRHQLRLSRPWEHQEDRLNILYKPTECADYTRLVNKEMEHYLKSEEMDALKKTSNPAAQLLRNQSIRLQELRDEGYFEDFRHMEFYHLIVTFYEDQGKSERIKNFPFPRQYASTALWLSVVFAAFVPFGMLDVFHSNGILGYAITTVLSGLIIWVFFLMEKIGDYSENPFEGTYNDVPITSIARTIEIDLREMIDDSNIPEPIKDMDGFLM